MSGWCKELHSKMQSTRNEGPGHARIATLYKEVGGLAARPREQFWVSTTGESAINRGNGNHLAGLRHLFNWTASMGRGLTFQMKFIRIEKRKSPISMHEIEQEVRQHFDKKSNLTCWAMSNCGFTFTDRVTLAKNLVRYLPEKLQLFGKGGKACMAGMDSFVDYRGQIEGDQFEDIRRQIDNCLFYFSFENSNCTDYITEKFSNPFLSYAIPIVNGWRGSYDKLLPGSYIHAKDFASGKELSEHMEYLRGNFSAYMEYHKWRQHFTIGDMNAEIERLHCEICERVRTEKRSGYHNKYIINDVTSVYRNMQTCVR
ncbi:4-galactosyl-N-acetylglucosaminide 3-alpha-L-fucosyltransferase 9-like isoform X2 [Convolutriloba macropyga]|uniref:4-galactosyl-N-acetylglucosaminide 3-alpha-L-fucosyltransferase 9-like isoform X2 n=1 Tax=Convolutriloba macropyga TaxID=536237 RepID=UPI003F52053C